MCSRAVDWAGERRRRTSRMRAHIAALIWACGLMLRRFRGSGSGPWRPCHRKLVRHEYAAQRNRPQAAQIALAFSQRPCRTYQPWRSEEHTSELQSLMRISYAVFCLKKNKQTYTATWEEQK